MFYYNSPSRDTIYYVLHANYYGIVYKFLFIVLLVHVHIDKKLSVRFLRGRNYITVHVGLD